MKPFNLETVLKYRRRLKDIAINRFQRAQLQRKEAYDAMLQKQNEYLSLIDTIETLEARGITVDEHILYSNRIEYVSEELTKRQEILRKKNETVVLERKQLIKKSKEAQVLEKLKEKQNLEYQTFINKKESAMLDEIAVLHRHQQESAETRELL